MNQVERAAHRRQQVLDFLNANPGARMGAIGECLFGEMPSRSRHHNTVRTMIDAGEVRFEGVARVRRYWANVKTTRSAADVQLAKEAAINRKNEEAKVKARITNSSYGIYVHKPGENRHGKPGEGGQGAIRGRVYAGICY